MEEKKNEASIQNTQTAIKIEEPNLHLEKKMIILPKKCLKYQII